MRKAIRALMKAPPGKRKRGRPWGARTNRGSGMFGDGLIPGLATRYYIGRGDVVVTVYMLMNNYHNSPEEVHRKLLDYYGVTVVVASIRRYRASAYCDDDTLTIYLPKVTAKMRRLARETS